MEETQVIAIILLIIVLAFCGAKDPEALGWLAVILFFLALGYFGLLDWI